jgi:xanthine dehydrogenase YagS FAD-binding subunit
MDGPQVADARIALGGVAHKPLRATAAEQHLAGHALSDATLNEAAALALRDARPLDGNGFKVALAQRAIVRAVTIAAGTNGGAA